MLLILSVFYRGLKQPPSPRSAPQCVCVLLRRLPAALQPFRPCALPCSLSERPETRDAPLCLSPCHSRSLARCRSRGGEAGAQGRRSSQGPDRHRFLRQRGGDSGRAGESTVKGRPSDGCLSVRLFLKKNEFPLCPPPDAPIRAAG